MRSSPSIVPLDDDQDVYLVLDDFGGQLGLAWRETDPSDAKLETVITDLMTGEYKNPVRVVPSTPPNAGRKTSPRTWPARSGGVSTYSFPMPSGLQDFVEARRPPSAARVAVGLKTVTPGSRRWNERFTSKQSKALTSDRSSTLQFLNMERAWSGFLRNSKATRFSF